MTEIPSRPKSFLYYLSFVLIWATVAWIGSMYMMDYEDKWEGNTESMWSWSSMQTSHKVGYVLFLTTQFPFGLIFGFFTGIYNNALFSVIINPLFIAWGLQMIFREAQLKHINQTLKINFIILTIILLMIGTYIWLE